MKKKRYDSRKLVPVAVIKAAAAGDPLAVQMVLNHYQGYIIWLSTRTMYDETGKYTTPENAKEMESLGSEVVSFHTQPNTVSIE